MEHSDHQTAVSPRLSDGFRVRWSERSEEKRVKSEEERVRVKWEEGGDVRGSVMMKCSVEERRNKVESKGEGRGGWGEEVGSRKAAMVNRRSEVGKKREEVIVGTA